MYLMDSGYRKIYSYAKLVYYYRVLFFTLYDICLFTLSRVLPFPGLASWPALPALFQWQLEFSRGSRIPLVVDPGKRDRVPRARCASRPAPPARAPRPATVPASRPRAGVARLCSAAPSRTLPDNPKHWEFKLYLVSATSVRGARFSILRPTRLSKMGRVCVSRSDSTQIDTGYLFDVRRYLDGICMYL